MANKSGALGTATANAVVRVLRANGWPHAERRDEEGRWDRGDIAGSPGVVWQVKGGKAAREASDNLIEKWLNDTEAQRANDGAGIGVLVLHRKGIGYANAEKWFAIVREERRVPDGPPWTRAVLVTVRYYLSDMCQILKGAGY